MVYDAAARKLFGSLAYLNFPKKRFHRPVRHVDFLPEKKERRSRYLGVTFFGHGGKRVKRWRSVYRRKTIGYFYTEKEAADAYIRAKQFHKSSVSKADSSP
jgi:hypothetical protein